MDELDFYTKAEINEMFGVAETEDTGRDFYTKAEIIAKVGTPETLVLPADMLDFYTKTEIDSIPTQTALTWPEYKALYSYSAGGAAHQLLWGTNAIYYQYYAALMAIMDGVYTNGTAAITPSNYSGVTGYYLRNGVQMYGSVYYFPKTEYTSGQSEKTAVFWGDDCGIALQTVITSGNTGIKFMLALASSYTGNPRYAINSALARRNMTVTAYGYGEAATISGDFSGAYFYDVYLGKCAGGNSQEIGTTSDVVGFGGFPSGQLLGNVRNIGALPTSEDFPTITAANAFNYIENVLNPWAVQNSAELETYLFYPAS